MNDALLADLLSGLHLAVVAFILLGQIAILVGGRLGWGWVRDLRFRVTHLVLILCVVVQVGFGQLCFLTVWENELRAAANQEGHEGSFVGTLLHDILFVDVDVRILNVIYVAFAVVVVGSLFLVPPRRRQRDNPAHVLE